MGLNSWSKTAQSSSWSPRYGMSPEMSSASGFSSAILFTRATRADGLLRAVLEGSLKRISPYATILIWRPTSRTVNGGAGAASILAPCCASARTAAKQQAIVRRIFTDVKNIASGVFLLRPEPAEGAPGEQAVHQTVHHFL